MADQPYHAHIYFEAAEREAASALRDAFLADMRAGGHVCFVGRMMATGVGPHPIPQYEVHFTDISREAIIAMIEPTGLRALVHPLTDDDLADHTTLGHWIGEPVELDTSVLDPPGVNQGIPRFGVSDF